MNLNITLTEEEIKNHGVEKILSGIFNSEINHEKIVVMINDESPTPDLEKHLSRIADWQPVRPATPDRGRTPLAELHPFDLKYNKQVAEANKITLIKMVRESQCKFALSNLSSKLTTSTCMGLFDAKTFVEKYFGIE